MRLQTNNYIFDILSVEAKQLILNGSPYNISGFHDIAVAPDNSFWLADSCGGIRSFNINTAEVSSSQILSCSTAGINNAFGGIAFSDNTGEDIAFVAESNYSDDIRRINLTTSTQTALFNNIYPRYNAGPMDLAAVVKPVPEPLTILGTGTAIAFGTGFKRQLGKAKKN
ncbi:PEP-CTERM sorting domain-containing protein [Crocosphaera sp.]|uniref:PEP-CTERM sorting domain-containing protein n=1 Tax=Crocosphaera sp. TaxID=2729996 RepID=UPI003F2290B1|nr:PEP-CTERM sorting domain-containing protein [Crocosphaera sp.]